jgi:hypothetical protein
MFGSSLTIMRPLVAIAVALSCSVFFASTKSFGQGAPPAKPPSAQPPYPYYQQPYPQPYPYYQQAQPGTYGPSPTLPYREGSALPAGYHLEERPRKGLVIAGAVVLGTTYVLSASIGMASTNTADRWLLVPVFGPFMDLGARGSRTCTSASGEVDCVFEPIIRIYLALDGVVQVAGAVLLTTGLVFRKKELVSDTYYGLSTGGPRITSWTVVPDVLPGSRYGLAFRGQLF